MTVTRIEAVAKAKYKVYLDGQFAFVLYKNDLSRYQVCEGAEMAAETYGEIRTEVVLKRVKLRALHLLNDMGRTEEQLRAKLLQGQCPPGLVEEAVDYVKSFGYINDRDYARAFIEGRKDRKSKKELCVQLAQKGISGEEIEAAVEACYRREDAVNAIEKIMAKRRFDPLSATDGDRRRMVSYLVRKGFCYEDVREVLQLSR